MITRTIAGLRWHAISPSFYELAGFPIDLSFVGDIWYLQCPDESGEPKLRPFQSKEEAAAMVASAFNFD